MSGATNLQAVEADERVSFDTLRLQLTGGSFLSVQYAAILVAAVPTIPVLTPLLALGLLLLFLRCLSEKPYRMFLVSVTDLAEARWRRKVVRNAPFLAFWAASHLIDWQVLAAFTFAWIVLSLLFASRDPRHRFPHDYLAGTVHLLEIDRSAPVVTPRLDLHPVAYGPVLTGPPDWARLEAPAGDDRPAHGRRW